MGERPVLEIALALKEDRDTKDIAGTCCLTNKVPENANELPPFEKCRTDKDAFIEMTGIFMKAMRERTPLFQKQGQRYIVQNLPAEDPLPEDLDEIF